MSTITLADVWTKQAELHQMIIALQTQQAAPTTEYKVPGATITLAAGERYAGLVLAADGTPSHHLVLLPDEAGEVCWEDAKTWANQRGELPTRQEQALLYANLKGEFQPTWYWSGEAHETDGSIAWCQHFDYGYQGTIHEHGELRARAVRRFTD